MLLSTPASAATYVVDATDDLFDGGCTVGHCSLREAITAANASAGADTIVFSNPNGPGPMVISITDLLPTITDDLTIDGLDCVDCGGTASNTGTPATGFNAALGVAIDGSGAPSTWSQNQGLLSALFSELHLVGLNLRNSPGSGVVW